VDDFVAAAIIFFPEVDWMQAPLLILFHVLSVFVDRRNKAGGGALTLAVVGHVEAGGGGQRDELSE